MNHQINNMYNNGNNNNNTSPQYPQKTSSIINHTLPNNNLHATRRGPINKKRKQLNEQQQ
jgi:hypothetical protein